MAAAARQWRRTRKGLPATERHRAFSVRLERGWEPDNKLAHLAQTSAARFNLAAVQISGLSGQCQTDTQARFAANRQGLNLCEKLEHTGELVASQSNAQIAHRRARKPCSQANDGLGASPFGPVLRCVADSAGVGVGAVAGVPMPQVRFAFRWVFASVAWRLSMSSASREGGRMRSSSRPVNALPPSTALNSGAGICRIFFAPVCMRNSGACLVALIRDQQFQAQHRVNHLHRVVGSALAHMCWPALHLALGFDVATSRGVPQGLAAPTFAEQRRPIAHGHFCCASDAASPREDPARAHSTVTLLARFLGLSTSVPFASAV